MKYFFSFISLLLFSAELFAQHIQLLDSTHTKSIRGLSVVNDKIVWVSGANGVVGRSVDGKTFTWKTVEGFEKTDFRDIEAFDESTAIIMGIDTPAVILKTVDGGKSWKKVFEDKRTGMFLDAMEFSDKKNGMVIGDPIDGKIFVAITTNGGTSWTPSMGPTAEKGEAMFASSGTNIRAFNKKEFCFITGGTCSRLFIGSEKIILPLLQSKESTGANSIAIWDKKTLAIVGGDFAHADLTDKNAVFTSNGGKTFSTPTTPPLGYRSCVEYLTKSKLITCGMTGVEVSENGGDTWRNISSTSFHVVRKAKKSKGVFLAGSKGRVAKLIW